MLFNGRQRATEIQTELKSTCSGGQLVVVATNPDPASMSYMRIKQKVGETIGITVTIETVAQEEIIATVTKLATLDSVDGIVVQLPLPEGINPDIVTSHIPADKDPDALGSNARVISPVARAVLDILNESKVSFSDVQAVVVGRGKLVGQPVTQMLKAKGVHLTIVDEETPREDFESALKQADIVVSGAGVPGLIQPHMLQRDCVLIDAGTSESGGKIVGDADPACESVARVMTPVPGGVGPLAVTMLFANLCDLIEAHE